MNEHELYLFDLQGFLVIPDALDANQLTSLNDSFTKFANQETEPSTQTYRFPNLLTRDRIFRDIIDNPRVMPYLDSTIGPKIRLDHTYADLIRSGKSPIGANLHGGGTPFNPLQYYHFRDAQIRCGLVVVAYNLRDVMPGDGGFACVPGSHKSNLRFPREWTDLTHPEPVVRPITGPAGTAIIFTEALTHGPLPWHGASERRTVFYKYMPYGLSYAHDYPEVADVDGISSRAKEMLEPPHV